MMISKKKRVRFSPTMLAFFALAALLLISGFLFGPTLRGATAAGFGPLSKAKQSLGAAVTSSFAQLTTKERLIRENSELKQALAEGEILVLDRNRLYEENLELKERLGRLGDPNAITGVVLLAPPATPYDTLLLDVGARDGVEVGDKVAAAGTVLIGEIREVYEDSARAVLYSASGESYEGFIAPANIPVTVEGLGGGALRGNVPPGVAVSVGDALSFPSISANVAAFVEHVRFEEGESHQLVYFRIPVNPLQLRHVDVWRGME